MSEVPLRVSSADEEEREGGRPSVWSEEPRSPGRKAGNVTFRSDPKVARSQLFDDTAISAHSTLARATTLLDVGGS
jgi:hypothetical protein